MKPQVRSNSSRSVSSKQRCWVAAVHAKDCRVLKQQTISLSTNHNGWLGWNVEGTCQPHEIAYEIGVGPCLRSTGPLAGRQPAH